MDLSTKIKLITAVILDVDGVLTDGRTGYSDGPEEIKFFNVRDGHGIKMARRAGLKVGLLSGRASAANLRRAQELGLDFVYQGEKNKKEAFARLLQEQQLSAEECLYMGDDLVDLPVLRRAGLAVTVADAVAEVTEIVHWQSRFPGGAGAVREMLEWLMREQGHWQVQVQRYLD